MRNLHLTFDWHYIGQIYSAVEISQNFVASSENMNVKKISVNGELVESSRVIQHKAKVK